MKIDQITTQPYANQKPGTSGLRKRVKEFQQKGYLENYIQSIFNVVGEGQGKSLVLGGDGRYYNSVAIQTIIRMAIAHGYKKLFIGKDGFLSTPAASHLVRKNHASGAIILSASHNPGGPDGDFGIKYNTENGAAAMTTLTEAVYQESGKIEQYFIADIDGIDLSNPTSIELDGTQITIIDSVIDYADLMESFFDFELIAQLVARPKFRFQFDAMNAITGPYAEEIFIRRLGAQPETVVNSTPLEDFGGVSPDPSPVHNRRLYDLMNGEDPLELGACSDGDGDRNMLLATGLYINPCDSLAIMLYHAQVIPGFHGKILGVARSMPTSRAVDIVAQKLDVPCYEVPTGWKYFGNLLDADMISLCGEESYGTGGLHVREKDGLWAVLYWLNLVASTAQPPHAIVRAQWQRYGRDYFTRHDYENIDAQAGADLYQGLVDRLPKLVGQTFPKFKIVSADNYSYLDPVDKSLSENQGIRIIFDNNARMVIRLSGTGTSGATLRFYFEQHEDAPSLLEIEPQRILEPLIQAGVELTQVERYTQCTKPSLII